MLFNSISFLLFFPFVTLVYFLVAGRYRWVWLLGASYYFYMNWNPTYAALILTSTIITYLSGRLIDASESIKVRRLWVTLSLVSNLGILFFYKYFNFFGETVASVLENWGGAIDVPSFNVLLPVGISFYTFQALSYTMDVYKGQIKPEKHFGLYALFVSFFPQLVAGPIERSTHLLPQFRQHHRFNYKRVKSGLLLMIWGYFKKLVIADRLAVLVNTVFNNPAEHHGLEILIATLFFTIQIYCDFSAYSDIAIGAARAMGYNLMQNFRSPYFSKSVTEFWRRWHISLSTWFRDYLYIPLGGSKKGKYRTYFNLFLIFLVSGLWHGAAMTFVVWGCLHGIYMVIEKVYKPYQEKMYNKLKWNQERFSFRLYRILVTGVLVSFAWIFFRANNISDSIMIVKNLFVWDFNVLFTGGLYKLGLDAGNFWIGIYAVIVMFAIEKMQHSNPILIRDIIYNQNKMFRWGLYYSVLLIILIFGYYGTNEAEFLYFQF